MGSRGVVNMILSRASRMKAKLQSSLEASLLEIEDVSHQHAGHAAMKGNTAGETHFNVKIVSPKFDGLNLVKRHRLVYDALAEELQSGLHALSIVAKTPQEEGAAAKKTLNLNLNLLRETGYNSFPSYLVSALRSCPRDP
ncbi:hypothetical protein POTOM_041761 [Populus tomentosa]|uniref:Uncharacterized protein n=1 Tax=Populus tomentosa TaxID=118781 RepID=A0A8X7YJ59_POPTO|nr:hypothetical protein POTOM_041761 [Populus tomentosa]